MERTFPPTVAIHTHLLGCCCYCYSCCRCCCHVYEIKYFYSFINFICPQDGNHELLPTLQRGKKIRLPLRGTSVIPISKNPMLKFLTILIGYLISKETCQLSFELGVQFLTVGVIFSLIKVASNKFQTVFLSKLLNAETPTMFSCTK